MIYRRDTEDTEIHREMMNQGLGSAEIMIHDFFLCTSVPAVPLR